jgi:hypothetical protein
VPQTVVLGPHPRRFSREFIIILSKKTSVEWLIVCDADVFVVNHCFYINSSIAFYSNKSVSVCFKFCSPRQYSLYPKSHSGNGGLHIIVVTECSGVAFCGLSYCLDILENNQLTKIEVAHEHSIILPMGDMPVKSRQWRA